MLPLSRGSSILCPKISVVTATFNALDGLKQTIESVASQSYPHVEHVVIDGGSTDGTRDYLESLGDAVKWLSEPDEGIADAMNKGVANSQGAYILFIQAEDHFSKVDSIARAVPHLEDCDLLSCNVDLQFGSGLVRNLRGRPFSYLTLFKMTCPHQGLFVRRDIFDRLKGFDSSFSIAMDYDFLVRAKRIGARLKCLDHTLSVMPATGVSTRDDWPSISQRLSEDRRLQWRDASRIERMFLVAFWSVYLPFKRIRHALVGVSS